MAKKKVTVSGGDTYYIEETSYSKYLVRGPKMSEAKVSSMEDALAMIKNNSGKDIKRID